MNKASQNINILWLRWTVNCAIGEVIGIGAAAGIAAAVFAAFGEPETTGTKILVLLCMMGAGLIEGIALGYFQWRVLRNKFSSLTRSAWIFQTALIAVLGWMLGMLPSLFFIDNPEPAATNEATMQIPESLVVILIIGIGLLLGTLFGLFQWFELKHHASGAAKWITANALGWGTGIACIYFFASLPDEFTPILEKVFYGICGGVLAGLSVGAVTGAFLVKMQER
ncbi:MAG: hypothetical protein ACRC3B_12450 [Bacteroidia bacterium]